MAETDNNSAGGVNDPLKMRNTETAALKRMPVSSNSASASSAARKTIKLKPLVSSAGSSQENQSVTPSPIKSVAPPSILLNRKPAATVEEPPKFMSTNTAPIGKMTRPEPEKPIPASDLSDSTMTKTVSIPRLQARLAPKPSAAPAPAPAPVSTATVSVPKITKPAAAPAPAPSISSAATVTVPKITKPAAAPTPAPAPVSTATVSVPKITKPVPATAVKPTYISTATAAIPPQSNEPASANAAAPEPAMTNTTTQGIQKQAINQAKMQSGLQAAKPAIKLRPSTSPAQEQEALSPTSPTIKLSPKTDSAVSPMPPPAEAQSEAPAEAPVKEEEVSVTTKIPRSKLQLKPSKLAVAAPNSAAQQGQPQLREQGDIANRLKAQTEEEGSQTIVQNTSGNTGPSRKNKKGTDGEPHILFAICAILAFLIIGYIVFALTAQFLNTWEQKNIPVFGFQQIDQSLRNK